MLSEFLHSFHPAPVLISFGPINIYWYGLFIVLGIILATLTTIRLAKYYGLNSEIIIDLLFWLVIAGLVGARLYDVLLELPYYLAHPLRVFFIWQGGLAIHGGLIAGATALWFYAKKRKLNFWLLGSLIVPGLALGQAIGRWGNYFNQEIFGRPTDLPWGIPIDFMNRPLAYINFQYFHPTFLYESLGNFIIFFILILGHIYLIKKRELNNFCFLFLVSCYLLLYSLLRFFIEFIRLDATPCFFGWRWPQIVSLGIILASLIFLLINYKKHDSINSALTKN